MARRKKHEEHEEHVNHERWLITYADMITLLMVLFIVLFAIGQTDLKKFEKLAGGVSNSLGGGHNNIEKPHPITSSGGDGILQGGRAPQSGVLVRANVAVKTAEAAATAKPKIAVVANNKSSLKSAQSSINHQLASAGLSGSVSLKIDERGLVVTVVSDKVLFDSGQATIQPEGAHVLDGIASVLAPLDNNISIEGHTDDRPISSAIYPSNWELSTGRAGSVLRYLAAHGVAAKRLKASGYADQHPVAPNDNDADRQKNRRVEIVVLANGSSKFQEDKKDG